MGEAVVELPNTFELHDTSKNWEIQLADSVHVIRHM